MAPPLAQSTTYSPAPLPTFTKRQVVSATVRSSSSAGPLSTTLVTTTIVVPPTTSPTPSHSKPKPKINVTAFVGGLVGAIAFLILVILAVWWFQRGRQRRRANGPSSRSRGLLSASSGSGHQRMLSDVPLLGDRSVGRSTMGSQGGGGGGGPGEEEMMYEPFQPLACLSPVSRYASLPGASEDFSFLVIPQTNNQGGSALQRNISLANSIATTESMYSMPSAPSSPTPSFQIPSVPSVPAQYLSSSTLRSSPPPSDPQTDDAFVSSVLRDRAKNSPTRQVTDISQISHVERVGSITSFTSTDEAELRRIRSRARGKKRSATMDTVTEAHTESSSNAGYEDSPVDPVIPEFSPRRQGRSTENLLLNGGRRVIREEPVDVLEEDEDEEGEGAEMRRITREFILPALPRIASLSPPLGAKTVPLGGLRAPTTPQPPALTIGRLEVDSDKSSLGSVTPTSANTSTILRRFPNPPPPDRGASAQGTDDTLFSTSTPSPTPVYDYDTGARSSRAPTVQPLSPPLFFLRDLAESESETGSRSGKGGGGVSRSTTASGSTSTTAVLRNSNPFKHVSHGGEYPLNLDNGNLGSGAGAGGVGRGLEVVEVNMAPPPPVTVFAAAVSSPTVSIAPKKKSVLPSVYPAPHQLSEPSVSQGTIKVGRGRETEREREERGSISSSMRPPQRPGHDRSGSTSTTMTTTTGSRSGSGTGSDVPSSLRPSRPGHDRTLEAQPRDASNAAASAGPAVATTPASLRPSGMGPGRMGGVIGPRGRGNMGGRGVSQVLTQAQSRRQSTLKPELGVPASLRVGSAGAGRGT